MNLTINKENGISYIKLNQEKATLNDSLDFREKVLAHIEKENANKIVVDFENVEFVDSSFLGALTICLKKVTEKMGDIRVTNLTPPVRVMFELTRLYKVFEVFDNNLDAIESF